MIFRKGVSLMNVAEDDDAPDVDDDEKEDVDMTTT